MPILGKLIVLRRQRGPNHRFCASGTLRLCRSIGKVQICGKISLAAQLAVLNDDLCIGRSRHKKFRDLLCICQHTGKYTIGTNRHLRTGLKCHFTQRNTAGKNKALAGNIRCSGQCQIRSLIHIILTHDSAAGNGHIRRSRVDRLTFAACRSPYDGTAVHIKAAALNIYTAAVSGNMTAINSAAVHIDSTVSGRKENTAVFRIRTSRGASKATTVNIYRSALNCQNISTLIPVAHGCHSATAHRIKNRKGTVHDVIAVHAGKGMPVQVQHNIVSGYTCVRTANAELLLFHIRSEVIMRIRLIVGTAVRLPENLFITMRTLAYSAFLPHMLVYHKAVHDFALIVCIHLQPVTQSDLCLRTEVLGIGTHIVILAILRELQFRSLSVVLSTRTVSHQGRFQTVHLHHITEAARLGIQPPGRNTVIHAKNHIPVKPQGKGVCGISCIHRIGDILIPRLKGLDGSVYRKFKHIPLILIRLTGRFLLNAIVATLHVPIQIRCDLSLHNEDHGNLFSGSVVKCLNSVIRLQCSFLAAVFIEHGADIVDHTILRDLIPVGAELFLPFVIIVRFQLPLIVDFVNIAVAISLCRIGNAGNCLICLRDNPAGCYLHSDQRCILLVDHRCQCLILCLGRERLAFTDQLINIVSFPIGLAFRHLLFCVILAGKVVINLGTLVVSSDNHRMRDLSVNISETGNTVIFLQRCCRTVLHIKVAGHIIDHTILADQIVGTAGKIAAAGDRVDGAHRFRNIAALTELRPTADTAGIVIAGNDRPIQFQTHHLIDIGIDLIRNGLILGFQRIALAVCRHVVHVVTIFIRLACRPGAIVLTAVAIVHGAFHTMLDNIDQNSVVLNICIANNPIKYLQRFHRLSDKIINTACIFRIYFCFVGDPEGADRTLLSAIHQALYGNRIALNGSNVVIDTKQLSPQCVFRRNTRNNVAFLIKQKSQMPFRITSGIDLAYHFCILTLQLHLLTVSGKQNGVYTVLIRFAGGNTFCAVIKLIHPEVNIRLRRPLFNKNMRGRILCVTVNAHQIHRDAHITRTYTFRSGVHVENHGLICDLYYQRHTVHSLRGVDLNGIPVHRCHKTVASDLHRNLLGVQRIDDHTIRIQHKSHNIHAVDVIDQFSICRQQFHLLSVNNKTEMVQAVCLGFAHCQTGFGVFRVGLPVYIPIEQWAPGLSVRRLLPSCQNHSDHRTCKHQCCCQRNDQPQLFSVPGICFLHIINPFLAVSLLHRLITSKISLSITKKPAKQNILSYFVIDISYCLLVSYQQVIIYVYSQYSTRLAPKSRL